MHKRDLVSVTRKAVEVLIALDMDSGKRCQLLRSAADGDGDGRLSALELTGLKERLQKLLVHPVQAEISGYPLRFKVIESKLDVRADKQASETGLSTAVLLRAELPQAITPGMSLVVKDESPDQSHVTVEIFQEVEVDAGLAEPVRQELKPGEQVKVRLGRLSDGKRN
jgi:hypothetical protein